MACCKSRQRVRPFCHHHQHDEREQEPDTFAERWLLARRQCVRAVRTYEKEEKLKEPSIPKRLKQSPAYHRSPKQEKYLAEKFGGETTPASGSKHVKGDVRVSRCMRIEAKTTSSKSFSVTREMIDKLESHSLQAGEVPVIIVEFLEKGKPVAEIAIVPTYALAEITDV